MATQYTDKLKLALPTQGELSGTWGTVVNDNITSMIEEAIAGRSVINTWTTNAHTLTTADGTTSESRCAMLEFTDTGTALTGAGEVICPAKSKLYVAKNGAGQTITVKTSSGTGVAVPNGETMWVYCDGTNVEEAVTYITSLGSGQLDVDNIRIDGNTISATDTGGDINVTPNGSGDVVLGNNDVASRVYFGGRNANPSSSIHLRESSNYVEYVHSNSTVGMEARIHNVMTSTNSGTGAYNGKLHGYALGTQTDAMTWNNSGATFPNDVTFTASGFDKITYSPGTPTTLKIVDGIYQYWGTGNDIEIGHSSGVSSIMYYGSSGYLTTQGTLYIKGVNHPMSGQSEDMIKAISNAGVSLYYNNSEKLVTTSNGIFIHDDTIGFGGNTLDAYETNLTVVEPTQDATISIPNKTANLSLVKYTDLDLTPNATSTTITLTGDDDIRHVQFRLDSISYSSGPTNPTMSVQTSSSVTHNWDIDVIRFNHYNNTTQYEDATAATDLLVWLTNYNSMPVTCVYNFYKLDSGRWTCEMIGPQGRGSTGYTILMQCATDIGFTYSNVGKILITTGSAYNITSIKGTIVEYY